MQFGFDSTGSTRASSRGREAEGGYYPFGRPGAGAPCRTESGNVITGFAADPDMRFQKQLRREVEYSLVSEYHISLFLSLSLSLSNLPYFSCLISATRRMVLQSHRYTSPLHCHFLSLLNWSRGRERGRNSSNMLKGLVCHACLQSL